MNSKERLNQTRRFQMKSKINFALFGLIFSLCGSFVSAHEDGSDHPEHSSTTSRQAPHADHHPKHGGEFFMAPDRFHHLEGVMATPKEFRIYLYDDHTQPISAVPFKEGAKVGVQKVGADGREIGTPVELSVSVDKSGAYLTSSVPAEFVCPLYFTTLLRFPGEQDSDLFNFTFDKVSVSAKPDDAETHRDMDKPSSETGVKKMAMYQCPMKDSSPQNKPGKCPKCGMNLEKSSMSN